MASILRSLPLPVCLFLPFFLCRLRNSTLFSLSLLAKGTSRFWLSILKNDVEISILEEAKQVLLLALASPKFFKKTHSLRLEQAHLKHAQLNSEAPHLLDLKICGSLMETDHPALLGTQLYIQEVVKSEPDPASFQLSFIAKYGTAYTDLLASASSLIIDAMPNLERLRVHKSIAFQFVRLRKTKGVLSSRILRGFSNLKVLHLGDDTISAKNLVWLLIFLESLTHLRASFIYIFEDEKFLLEHQETLRGKATVTHLDLTVQFVFDPKKRWPTAPIFVAGGRFAVDTGDMKATQLMGLVLGVTKNLVQMKLHVVKYSNFQVPASISLSILSHLGSSLHSLKHLALHGAFKDPPSSFQIGEPQGININRFEALETLSVDFLPISAFRQFCLRPDSLNMSLFFPNLKTLQFFSSRQEFNLFPEQEVIHWINSTPLYFKALKQVLCSKNPVWFQEQIIDLTGVEAQWNSLRKSLRNLCDQRGLMFILLEDQEQSESTLWYLKDERRSHVRF